MCFDVFHVAVRLINSGEKLPNAPDTATYCNYTKRLIKQVKHHLMIQKNRRYAIVRQSRFDIAQLLHNGLQHIALSRVEQHYKDQCKLSAYDQIEQFCDCIYSNIRDISRHSKLSADVKEAASSLIFASSRCGELPELHLVRKLFKNHFGEEFERDNVELLPRNTVNSQVKHNLSKISLPDNAKVQLINEIAGEYNSINDTKELRRIFYVQLQMQPSKFEDMLRRFGSKFSIWNSYNGSASTAGSNSSKRTDLIAGHMNDDTCFSNRATSNVTPQIQERVATLDSWVENVSSKTNYTKKNNSDTRRRGPLIKNDAQYAISGCLSQENKMIGLGSSDNEHGVVVQSCTGTMEEYSEPRLSHVHPKLPDYDELVAKFKTLKKECAQRSSDNPSARWMWW
ncbi:hypothetical protein RJ639_031813 [Escallonia herrerae]|uniref:Uncharacterized protein n=1 Tax=Escallonia herrerae TaxID=1293975 RepID=A0AA89BIL7_9ASTE|nr:hypothetical protein RJ639_031813 [Escallonia herrerae]